MECQVGWRISYIGWTSRGSEYAHAIVVLILPTFVSKDIFANSIANAGVSVILSRMIFEHFVELYSALT